MVKSLEQLKEDAKQPDENGNRWPWEISAPHDERALLDGYRPEIARADKVRKFFAKMLYLPKETGGVKPFRLMDWQFRDVIAPLFAWVDETGKRRFNRAFVSMGKKQGKSTLMSGLALYMLIADQTEEAEVIGCATDRDQAGIVFRKASRAVKLSPSLRKVCRCVDSRKQILFDQRGSRFEAISSDADSSEGLGPSCLILDELHVWKDKAFFDSLLYATIARPQGLTIAITTAGNSDQSLAYGEYQYSKELLSGETYNPHYFAYIAEAPDGVAWDTEEAWLAAQPSLRGDVDQARDGSNSKFPRDEYDNPSVRVQVGSIETMRQQCEEAKSSPRKKRAFTRYLLNRWTVDAENTWISTEAWNQCAGESIPHFDEPCAGGLDLSGSRDMTSFCQAFQRGDIIDLEWLFWIPEEGLKEREDEWRVPLRDWVAQGWITATPGNVVDYAYIRQTISGARFDEKGSRLKDSPDAIAAKYDLRVLAYDPWNSRELCEKQLFNEDGIKVAQHRQGYRSMSEPCKVFERMVLGGKINHGANPVAAWQAKNVVIDTDPAGNIKPNKDKSRAKIDGIVAAIMAVGVVSLAPDDFQRVTGSLFIH